MKKASAIVQAFSRRFMANMKRLPLLVRLSLVLGALLLSSFLLMLPDRLFRDPYSGVLLDRDGELLSASIAADGQWRFPATDLIPDKFIACITTFEDRRFFRHPGVDARAIMRAAWKNWQQRSVEEGGSTLTMQVVRLWRNNQQRSLWNKVEEAVFALRLEFRYSKRQLLAMYAAHAPFGGNVVGLEAASWRYYGRDAHQLSWGEMAALAVLPNAPALVHPGKNRNVLLEKRNRLLDALVQANYIDQAAADLAKAEALPGSPKPLPNHAYHLLQRMKAETSESDSALICRSTLHASLQLRVNQVVASHHQLLRGNGIHNLAVLIADVSTGQTLAYVGNHYAPDVPDWESHVDILNAPRSPGSTLKPFLYAAAMSDGLISPRSWLADIPTQIGGYTPENFDRTYLGAVAASDALARSLNIPAVRLLQQYKYVRFYALLQAMGIRTLKQPADHYGLSLILGGAEVTPWDLGGVYASLVRMVAASPSATPEAAGRFFHPLRYRLYATSASKRDVPAVAIDAVSAWHTLQAMQEVMRPGEEALWQQFGDAPNVSWKTGTSFGFRDGWSIGVNSEYMVLVWTGNADGEGRAGLIGVQTAAPVMFDLFRLLPRAAPVPKPEQGFTTLPICRSTGFRPSLDCIAVDTIWGGYQSNQIPMCSWHTRILTDPTGAYRLLADCSTGVQPITQSWLVLPPAMAYYYQQHQPFYKPLPPLHPSCAALIDQVGMDIIYPSDGAQLTIPREWTGELGKLIFTATHSDPDARLFWSMDQEPITTTRAPHQVSIQPQAGAHELVVVDKQGNRVTRRFVVRLNAER